MGERGRPSLRGRVWDAGGVAIRVVVAGWMAAGLGIASVAGIASAAEHGDVDSGNSNTVAVAGGAVADAAIPDSDRELSFSRHGVLVGARSLGALLERRDAETIRVHEPYEDRVVEFRALPFADVLDDVMGGGWRDGEEFVLTCSDGYQPTVPVERFLRHRAWLTFDRVGADGFSIDKLESGSRRRVELGPFYLVWENLDDERVRAEADYGWPYQLVGIELARTDDRFAAMRPPAAADAAAQRGFQEFRVHCAKCHAVNGQGGTIGPDLNVPVNPVEYRERAWLRTFIDNPAALRPESRMPRLNPALDASDRRETIDALLAYLTAMTDRKIDASGSADGGSPDAD